MSVYESIIKGLNEAIEHQSGAKPARSVKLTITPVPNFDAGEIKKIRQRTGLSQIMFASSLGVSKKTVEAWERGRNKPEGSSRRLLEIVRDDPEFLSKFHDRQQESPRP